MAEEGNEPQDPQGGGGEPPTDWKAEARKWERRSKENAEKAKAYDELQEKSKTDLEKAQEAAKSYKEQLDALSAKAEKDALRAKVAKATGVPVELVSGDDEESMTEFAKAVAKFAKPDAAPRSPKPGTFAGDAGDDSKAAYRELADQMFGNGD